MALSNAEKQAAYRARYAANKERVAELEEEIAALKKASAPGKRHDPELAEKLDQYIGTLFEEGVKDLATFSPNTVRRHVVLIERLLVEHGIMPESERSHDPRKYAAKVARTHARTG